MDFSSLDPASNFKLTSMLSPSIFGNTVDLISPAFIALIVITNEQIKIKITVKGFLRVKDSRGA